MGNVIKPLITKSLHQLRLLAFAEEQAAAASLDEIKLYTHVTMTENQAYYPRHGYVETHREHDGGFDRVFFRKRLG